jgi:hypothetical protein
MSLSRVSETTSPEVPSDETKWQLEVSRLGQRVSQTYRLAPDGCLEGMTETTVLLWPRELIPLVSTLEKPREP